MDKEKLVQLLSEPGLIAVGDFVDVTSRPGKTADITYYAVNMLVGSSTERFDIKAEAYGMLKTAKRYQRCYVVFTETTFRQSGNTVKNAVSVMLG
jgi:hypothetical protein